MQKRITVGLAVAGAFTLTALPAFADIAPLNSDVVGVGSDTVQNISDFVSDGDYDGDPGYNTAGGVHRVFNFDATPDANDRAGYLNGSTNSALKQLNPTVVLRAGNSPVLRPNGSGAGISALLADTGAQETINYVRSSRPPKGSEQTTAQNLGWGGLRVVRISNDTLSIAVNASGTNAPAGLSVPELKHIYNCDTAATSGDGKDYTHWSGFVTGGSSDAIIPLVPQAGSGTRSSFLADIGVTTPGPCVQTVEENDPSAVTGASVPADAIDPFSGGRINLYNDGYFTNPTNASQVLTAGVKLLTGASPDGAANYADTRGLYIIFRNKDASLATPFQPGGSRNWAQELFISKSGSTPFYASGNGQLDIADAGATPSYADLGNTYSVG